MKCFNCGYPLHSEKIEQCPICHVSIGEFCISCHGANPKFANHCVNCGRELNKTSEKLSDVRKKMAIMFADISGFTRLSETMDHEDVKQLIDSTFKELSKVVYEYGGEIDKFIGDCIMVTFGRTLTHYDDGKNSVKCAWALHRKIKALSASSSSPLKLSIGINYGEVTLGLVGSVFDNDYTVMGDVVNTAQRLQTKATPGQTLVSEDLYRLTQNTISYSSPVSFDAKNKEFPILGYHPLELIDQHINSPIFQRDTELAKIEQSLKNGTTPCLVGDAGLGKTSLVHLYLKNKRQKAHWVTCEQQYLQRPFYSINQWIYGFDYDLNHILDNLYVNPDIKQSYRKLLLSINLKVNEGGDVSTLLQLSPDIISNLTLEAYCDLYNYLNTLDDVLFVADDIQWMDQRSIEVVQTLSQSKNIQVLLISRVPKLIKDATEIILEPLTIDGVKKIIEWSLETNDLHENVCDFIFESSMGNPMIAKAFLEQMKLNNLEATTDIDALKVLPNSMERLILENFESINSQCKDFLKQASVIGKAFNIKSYSQYLKNVDFNMQQLEKISWVRIDERSDSFIYFEFLSDTHKQVLYDSISNLEKNKGHRALINISKDYEMKLYHALMIDDSELTRNYSIKLGEDYYKQLMYKDAHLKYDLAIAHGMEERLISDQLFNVYDKINMSEQALDLIEKLLLNATNYNEKLTLYKRKAAWELRIGALDHANETASLIINLASKNSNYYGYASMFLGNIARIKGSKDAPSYFKTAYERLYRTEDYEALSEIKRQIGILNIIKGLQNNAQKALEEALTFAHKSNNDNQVSRINNNLAMVYFANGVFIKSEEMYLSAIAHARKVLDERLETMSLINLSIAYMKYGFMEKSKINMDKAIGLSKSNNMQYHYLNACVNEVEWMFMVDDMDFEKVHKISNTLKEHDMPIESNIINLYISLQSGKIDENSIEVFKDSGEMELVIDAYDLSLLLCEYEDLLQDFDLDRYTKVESKLEQIKLLRIMALYHKDSKHLRKAIDLSKLIGNSLELVKCYAFGLKYNMIDPKDVSEFMIRQFEESNQTIFHRKIKNFT